MVETVASSHETLGILLTQWSLLGPLTSGLIRVQGLWFKRLAKAEVLDPAAQAKPCTLNP